MEVVFADVEKIFRSQGFGFLQRSRSSKRFLTKCLGGRKSERDQLDLSLRGGQRFGFVDGVSDGIHLADVCGGIGDVFLADAVEGGDSGGAETEIVRTLPVALIMLRVLAGLCVVRGLVMIESGGGEDFLGEVVVVGVVVFALLVGAVLEGVEKSGVLLVGEIVGGNVVGSQGNCVVESGFPVCPETGRVWKT